MVGGRVGFLVAGLWEGVRGIIEKCFLTSYFFCMLPMSLHIFAVTLACLLFFRVLRGLAHHKSKSVTSNDPALRDKTYWKGVTYLLAWKLASSLSLRPTGGQCLPQRSSSQHHRFCSTVRSKRTSSMISVGTSLARVDGTPTNNIESDSFLRLGKRWSALCSSRRAVLTNTKNSTGSSGNNRSDTLCSTS